MAIRRVMLSVFGLAGLMAAGSGLSQQASAQQMSAPTPKVTAPDSDEAFMTGLRRIGVMGGEVIQCSTSDQRSTVISQATQLSNNVALHFGLVAAFNFSASVGYGSGKPFDKSGCAAAESGWNDITQKYLNQ